MLERREEMMDVETLEEIVKTRDLREGSEV